MSGILYICPTPIGNLGDITLRTLDVLREADCVCAEDTRVTGRLLAHFGIEKRIERLDEASITHKAAQVIARIAAGERIAFCSDAGMPGVSDPGARLIAQAQEQGVEYTVLPGASAAATAYVASGIAGSRYYFGGFLPRKAGERRALFGSLAGLEAVLVFYESPHRLVGALESACESFPGRELAVCRELTKLHEEVYRGTPTEALAEFSAREGIGGVKGEVVLVIGPPTADEAERAEAGRSQDAAKRVAELLEAGVLSKKDIVAAVRKEFGLDRNAAYDLVHSLQA